MNIADILIKQIFSDPIPLRREDMLLSDQLPSIELIAPEFFADALDLEVFQHCEPDSGEYFTEEAPISLLGSYQWMSSPGVIKLYRGNIEAYWKCLLKMAHQHFPFMTVEDIRYILSLVTHSVYQHERFHYVCDFCRRVFSSQFDCLHEEALAVAHTWHWLHVQGGNTTYGRLHPMLRRAIVHARFDYRSPGYRDWRQFSTPANFHAAITDYLDPRSRGIFAGTDFNFARWALTHVPDDSNRAWEEMISQ